MRGLSPLELFLLETIDSRTSDLGSEASWLRTSFHVSFRIAVLSLFNLELVHLVFSVNNIRHMILYHSPMPLSRLATLRDDSSTMETRPRMVDDVVGYTPGDMVPWHFVPSIIVASFFASFSGTLLTIELLQRKRLGKSLMSRQVLSSAHVSYIVNSVLEYIFWLVR